MNSRNHQRDLKGDWGRKKQVPPWPDNAKLAVSFVVNVEKGSELSVRDGDESNEPLYDIREEVKGVPDLCMESHFDYWPRRAYESIVDALERYGAKAARMLSIGLYLRIIGKPARIAGLHEILEYVSNHDAVWVATRKQIADSWRLSQGLESWNSRTSSH